MNTWDRTRQDTKFKQKLQNVKSTLPKIGVQPSQPTITRKQQQQQQKYQTPSPQAKTNKTETNYTSQNTLKHLLQEFGLSQYLRKVYEFGYGDNNIYKIGELSYQEFEELLFNLKIFPGHQVKMRQLYNYLKQMNILNVRNKNIHRKPNTSGVGSRRIIGANTTGFNRNIVNNANPKPRSVGTRSERNPYFNKTITSNRTNNGLLNSFYNQEFGYTYYLNDHNKTMNQSPIKEGGVYTRTQVNFNRLNTPKIEGSCNDSVIDSSKNEDTSMGDEIDKMWKYYMIQWNTKLDESYDMLEDSSLSHININGNDKIEIKKSTLEKRKLEDASSHNKYNVDKRNTYNFPMDKACTPVSLPKIDKGGNSIMEKNKEKDDDDNNMKREHEDKKNQREENENAFNKEEEEEDNRELGRKKQIKDNSNNGINTLTTKQEDNCKQRNIATHKETDYNNNKPDQSNPSDENYVFQKEEILKDNLLESKLSSDNHQSHDPRAFNHKSNSQNQQIDHSSNLQTTMNQNSNEEEIYDNIRLNKSCEENYIRQNMNQFDIEYMCRCLGLAIMKHLQEGKDKQHITDLLDINEGFSFFNSMYNTKIEFLINFFSKESGVQELSNWDKLDIWEHENSKEETINFMSHLKKKDDEDLIKKTEVLDRKNKGSKVYGISDKEKDIKFIDEFFSTSNSKRPKNYHNLSDKTKFILNKELSYINEIENESSRLNSAVWDKSKDASNKCYENELRKSMQKIISNIDDNDTLCAWEHNEDRKKEERSKETAKENTKDNELNNRFSSLNEDVDNNNKTKHLSETPWVKHGNIIDEEIPDNTSNNNEIFESGEMESNYLIDASTVDKLKTYILKQTEIFDDDYYYPALRIQTRKYVPLPDPQAIFEFCANIMILTKMEKEVIIVTLIYLERLIFNTGTWLTSRNWRRLSFTSMIMASKIWDDDSFENNHFAQVFTHLTIGEINWLERTYLEWINYKVNVKCSEYFKYFFIIKSIALKYNYNGLNLVPISVEKMMKIQEYAFQMQRKMKKKYSLNISF